MKQKILKIGIVILLLITLTMANFISVGMGLISYAESNKGTNNQNIEFDAQLVDNQKLSIEVKVKDEGYFNGEITLEDSNFKLKSESNQYINKIEGNKITLNQINAGTTAKIDIGIEPVKEDIFEESLLNRVSKIQLNGTYRDSRQKDINVEAKREVEFKYIENNQKENVRNEAEVITNKIVKVAGEDKRVIQILMNMGLTDNNYPIKSISNEIVLPTTDVEKPRIIKNLELNNMTKCEETASENGIILNFTNEPNQENKILWNKAGNEKAVVTFIYNKEANLEKAKFQIKEKVKLYNDKELETSKDIEIGTEEKDAIVESKILSAEPIIYKGKLLAKIDREYEINNDIIVNLANAQNGITINEQSTKYIIEDKEVEAKAIYRKTIISKEKLNNILGENGVLTISNEQDEIIATINKETQSDENGNIIIEYTSNAPSSIKIKTTTPVSEGILEIKHIKAILGQSNVDATKATQLSTKVEYEYGTNINKTAENKIELREPTTEAEFKVNKESLSTILNNNVEIRATLIGNDEKYNLYENPKLTFELPQEVEEIAINNTSLMFGEEELKIKNAKVEGKNIIIELEGKQTQYKQAGLIGTDLVINANIKVNRKAPSKDEKIIMKYENKGTTGIRERKLKVEAPKDMTVVNSIKELGIETIGQEKIVQAPLEMGSSAKQLETGIEVINNKNKIENAIVVGNFPTQNKENNIAINMIEGINAPENTKVYYTENENANEDLQKVENGWKENITDGTKVKKYLMQIPSLENGADFKASYKMEIPASLDYNQKAKETYSVLYSDGHAIAPNRIDATTIELQTGVGPKLEAKLEATLGGKLLKENDTIRNGEVVKYKVEVKNVGSVPTNDITVKGTIPEGTTLVKPQENYEYTGASYYKEFPDKTYEEKITDTIEIGETKNIEYEIRVNTKTQEGVKIANEATIAYGNVNNKLEGIKLITKPGNLRVSVKRVTDREARLSKGSSIKYFAIIENISDSKQENIKLKANLPDELEMYTVYLYNGMKSKEVTDQDLEGNDTSVEPEEDGDKFEEQELPANKEINIKSLEKGETKVIAIEAIIKTEPINNIINFSMSVEHNKEEYKSNQTEDKVLKTDVTVEMTANPKSGSVIKAGDTIIYNIIIKNNSQDRLGRLSILDDIPKCLTVKKVIYDKEEISKDEDINNNIIIYCDDIEGNSQRMITIEAIVNYSETRTKPESITNIAYAEILGEKVANSQSISHIIEAVPNGGSDDQNNDVPNPDIATGNKMIAGVAWLDENTNGIKDINEKTFSNIKVHLLNAKTNNFVKDEKGNILESITDQNGGYILNNIGNGKYIVVFDYDNTKYGLTKYKVAGAEESNNSNAMINKLIINGTPKDVASTDIIQINNNNVSNINVGFIELKVFDLKLEKSVSKIIIQNKAGTTVKEYNDEKIAKTELDAKRVNGSNIIIEYKIKVSNVGEIEGYAKKIVDYLPSDLKFSSELNKDWYQTQEGVFTTKLANDKIKAGETKELKLTVTKSMTSENTGLINNTAEIAQDYNELDIEDINSTPANRSKDENDYGSADVILGIRTGRSVYISIIILISVTLAVVAVVIIKKKSNNKNKEN